MYSTCILPLFRGINVFWVCSFLRWVGMSLNLPYVQRICCRRVAHGSDIVQPGGSYSVKFVHCNTAVGDDVYNLTLSIISRHTMIWFVSYFLVLERAVQCGNTPKNTKCKLVPAAKIKGQINYRRITSTSLPIGRRFLYYLWVFQAYFALVNC